jgi:hypothetical protein
VSIKKAKYLIILTTFQKLTTNYKLIKSLSKSFKRGKEERKKQREEREKREKEEQEAKEKEAREKGQEK